MFRKKRKEFYHANRLLKKQTGFTLLEVLLVVGIIGILASIVLFNIVFTTKKGRDAKRISDLTTMGRFFAGGECRTPLGDMPIDLIDFADEFVVENPQLEQFISSIPKDPKTGSESASKYFYLKSEDDCVIYANLENLGVEVTLTELDDPTPGGGQGILQGMEIGSNGTDLYYQFSN